MCSLVHTAPDLAALSSSDSAGHRRDCLRPSVLDDGKGSDWARFRSQTHGHRGPLTPSVEDAIAAGQRPVTVHDRRRPQRIASTLRIMYVFPMTYHVDCVALLEKPAPDLG